MRASTQVQSTEEISEEDIKKYTAGHENNNKKSMNYTHIFFYTKKKNNLI
jgi:hypothetical protein